MGRALGGPNAGEVLPGAHASRGWLRKMPVPTGVGTAATKAWPFCAAASTVPQVAELSSIPTRTIRRKDNRRRLCKASSEPDSARYRRQRGRKSRWAAECDHRISSARGFEESGHERLLSSSS